MHSPLNIPLGTAPTTRRDTRRVVSVIGGALLGVIFGIAAFRAPFVASSTLSLAPEHTVTTMRILKTRATERIISAHLGLQPLFPGSVLTWNDAMSAANSEIAVYVLEDGSFAFGVDAPLPNILASKAREFDLQIMQIGDTSLIGSKKDIFPTKQKTTLIFSSLIPWHKGEIVENGKRHRVGISETGITLYGSGFVAENNHMTAPPHATVRAHLSFPANSHNLPTTLFPLAIAPLGDFLDHFLQNGGDILLFDDTDGNGFSLTTKTSNMTQEDLAAAGKDIINRQRLSTRVLTNVDGTRYSEIYSDRTKITVDIRAEENFSFITLANEEGDTIRMTRTPETITIANRKIGLEKDEKTFSLCLHSAHTWMQTSLLNDTPSFLSANNSALLVFIHSFSEVAFSDHDTRICW